ncbi:MAG: putative Transposon Ty3-I Gag-Pol polyprotein, partial [Streblomastix strix]
MGKRVGKFWFSPHNQRPANSLRITRTTQRKRAKYLHLYKSGSSIAAQIPGRLDIKTNIRAGKSKVLFPKNHAVVTQTLWKGAWLTKFDLTEAYSYIQISEIDQQYLGFEVFGKSFRYMTLPFGISCAPAIFTKLVIPVLAKIRSLTQAVIYMEYGLIISPTFEEAKNSTLRTLSKLRVLELTIKFNKSQLVPKQKLDFLGWEWDTQEVSVKLSQLRRQEALSLVKSWLKLYNTNMVSIKNLARLIGVLQATAFAEPLALLKTKQMTLDKNAQAAKKGWNSNMPYNCAWTKDLQQQMENLSVIVTQSFNQFLPSIRITTDASPFGWGSTFQDRNMKTFVRKYWKKGEWNESQNKRELIAVRNAINYGKQILIIQENQDIQIVSDNMTVVSIINRKTAKNSLIEIALAIFQTTSQQRIRMRAEHIPSKHNNISDQLSRWKDTSDLSIDQKNAHADEREKLEKLKATSNNISKKISDEAGEEENEEKSESENEQDTNDSTNKTHSTALDFLKETLTAENNKQKYVDYIRRSQAQRERLEKAALVP